MARPAFAKLQNLLLGVAIPMAMAIGGAACSSSSGTPNIADAGGDDRTDMRLASDGADGNVDAHVDRANDPVDVQMDVGSDGMDQAADDAEASVEAGHDLSIDDVPPTDVPMDRLPEVNEDTPADSPDGGVDLPPDLPATDGDAMIDVGPTDVPPEAAADVAVCGTGCPSTVHGDKLALWLAADFGVTCVSGRVTSWQDRGGWALPVVPVTGKTGPRCGVDSIAGRDALFFDRPGSDDLDGVLTVDLNLPLKGTDYTVFVVERRQSNTDGYILGTGGGGSCADDSYYAYRFGYTTSAAPPSFVAGPYAYDNVGDNGCLDPFIPYGPYSASDPAALEIEVFGQRMGHSLAINGAAALTNTDENPIVMLPPAFIGRAFDAPTLSLHHSRYLGDVAEIVIYSAVLTDDERTQVTSYLQQRWNLAL